MIYDLGSGRLRQFVAYARNTFGLKDLFNRIEDERRKPITPPALIAGAVFFCGLLRIRSFNALEPRLRERPFVRLTGAPRELQALCSVDTVSRALRSMNLDTVSEVSHSIVAHAERMKVFREGWHGTLRYVALDGWEPFLSYNRHCEGCLIRNVRVKQSDGTIVEKEQYYHRYVVAMLIDGRFDLALDFEPLLPNALRPEEAAKNGEDEGELTAAIRLLRRVKGRYHWLDVVVGDGLYSNGPFLSEVAKLRMGAVVIAKKEADEPLKEALSLWQHESPQVVVDEKKRERIQLWDCPEIQTLDSYKGPIRVVRGIISNIDRPEQPRRTWCMLVTGIATKLSPQKILSVARGRWHIENTGFHQWTTRWCFDHVFVHHAKAIQALFWLFFAAFNLLTLFLYRQLRSYGRDRGKDVTQTVSRLIDEMLDDLARLHTSPWWDSS